MAESIRVNGLTLCHKNSSGMVQSTIPDICKAPTYPAPFVNIAFSRDLAKGTKTVKSHNGAMCGIKGAEFSRSVGDEAGVGKGVKSGTNMGKATFLSWSSNVFMEGKPVTRLTDKMLMNDGNTISAGGYFTGIVTGANRVTLDLLCEIACACLGVGNQNCVALALNVIPRNPLAGIYPEITFTPDGTMYRNPDGSPQTRMGVPGSRLDVTTVLAGVPVEFIEMKFPGDRLRGTQKSRYEAIALQNGKQLQLMYIPRDCNYCQGGAPEPVPVPVPVPAPAPVRAPVRGGLSGWEIAGIGVLVAGAAAATWYAGGSGGLAVASFFGLTMAVN